MFMPKDETLIRGVKRKSAPNPTNWQFADKAVCKEATRESLPSYVDLTGDFPVVYRQTCGSCTSNAVLACDAYYWHRGKPNWDPSTVFTYYNQRKMDHALKDPDDGSTVECALNAVRKFGACSSKVWPNSKPYYEKPSPEAYANGLKGHELTTYHGVKTLLQIRKALALGYPVVMAMSFKYEWFHNGNYILSGITKKEADSCDFGHGVVIVGYDDTKRLFKIRNSWGPDWGDNGHFYISYDCMKNVIWWDDTYAVVK